MIDIESRVFTRVKNRIKKDFTDVQISSDYVDESAKFPCVTFIEVGNISEDKVSFGREHTARITYEINIYTNDEVGRKTKAKKIAKAIDEELELLGFTRVMFDQVPNYFNPFIFRMVGRYEAIVDQNFRTYRR